MRRFLVPFAAIAVHVGTASPWLGEVDRTPRGAYVEVAGHRINQHVLASIQDASRRTGVSFGYLMAQAGRESAFRSDAGSRLSSAAGLYQFTAATWLMMMKEHGPAYGYGQLAEHIVRERGTYAARDGASRARILELRRDPRLAALMAGEYAKDNGAFLEQRLGRPIRTTDLYLAHFLGPYGALKFLEARAKDAGQAATKVVTAAAARNNASIFYDERRTPRSVAQVYDVIHALISRPIERYAHLEQARPWAAAWTETIETAGDRLVVTMPQRDRAAAITIAYAPPPAPTMWEILAMPPEPAGGHDADDGEAVQVAAAGASHHRIDQAMPPPPGAAIAATPGAFGWLLAPFRGLLDDRA